MDTMEKACHSSAINSSSTTTSSITTTITTNTVANTNSSNSATTSSSFSTTTTSSHVQSSLKSLNKASYKISKPLPKSSHPNPNPNSVRPSPPPSAINSSGTPPQQPQPPVYNIDKNDFRDVVQKLTGSPAHHHPRPAVPPPAPPAVTSRLHRIRPPPLAHLPPRSPPLAPAPPAASDVWMRPSLSPLPPFPAVSAASESPISAYMRRLRDGGGGQLPLAPSPSAVAPLLPPPTSPLGFGCLPSPRTAFQMMISSGMVFPTSPGVPLPSPRWGDP